MDWLLEILLPIALVLFYLFQRTFFQQDEQDVPPPGQDKDTEAKRIQEEIRRKIVERQQGKSGERAEEEPSRRQTAHFPGREESPTGFPRTEPPPVPADRPAPLTEEPPPVTYAEPSYRDLESELRAQRERVRETRKAREEAMAEAATKRGRKVVKPVARRKSAVALRDELLDDLQTRDSLRRALVLKEVLDRPVGLRERTDAFNNF